MRPHRPPWVLRTSVRVYTGLLALYPARYRAEYGPAMAQLFRDLSRAAYGQARGWGLAALWVRVLADLSASAGEQHWQAARAELRQLDDDLNLSWLQRGWPALALASLLIVGGIAGKALILQQTQSAEASVGVLVGTALLAAIVLDRAMRAAGQLLAAAAVIIGSLVLPLTWTPDSLAWLRANPTTAYTVALLPFAWQRGERPWRSLWSTTLIYAATNLIVALLIGP